MTEKDAIEMYRREFIGIGVKEADAMIVECEKIATEYGHSGITFSYNVARTELWDGRIRESFRERVLKAAWEMLVSGISEADIVRCLAEAAKLADASRCKIETAAAAIVTAQKIGMSDKEVSKLIDRCGFAARMTSVYGEEMVAGLALVMGPTKAAGRDVVSIPAAVARLAERGWDTRKAMDGLLECAHKEAAQKCEAQTRRSFREVLTLIKNYILG